MLPVGLAENYVLPEYATITYPIYLADYELSFPDIRAQHLYDTLFACLVALPSTTLTLLVAYSNFAPTPSPSSPILVLPTSEVAFNLITFCSAQDIVMEVENSSE